MDTQNGNVIRKDIENMKEKIDTLFMKMNKIEDKNSNSSVLKYRVEIMEKQLLEFKSSISDLKKNQNLWSGGLAVLVVVVPLVLRYLF